MECFVRVTKLSHTHTLHVFRKSDQKPRFSSITLLLIAFCVIKINEGIFYSDN
jgi:hypothetical protein